MKLLLLCLAFLAAFGAAATFGREYRVAYFARGSQVSAFDTLSSGVAMPDVPLSSRSMRELFETCGAIQQSFIYILQTAEPRRAVDASCASLATAALQRNPTYAGAHTILMMSSDTDAQISASLVLSQQTAPLESWHAKLRLAKGLPLYGKGQQGLDRALDLDIAFMVKTQGGRAWIARLYQSEPVLRPTIVAMIDRSPNDVKAAFLQEVRRIGKD